MNDRAFDGALAQIKVLLRARRRRQIQEGLMSRVPGGEYFVQGLMAGRLSEDWMAPQNFRADDW